MSVGSDVIELRLVGDRWVLTGDSYVLHRAEKAIPFGKSESNGAVSFPATEETAVELMWFQQRFKFHCRHEMVLRSAAAKYNLRMLETQRVMAGKYEPGLVQFRKGLEPREYQRQGAMMWRATRNLLCADDLGTGKAQPLDCRVLTPTGWSTFGELKVGDEVVDPDGGTGFVTGVFDRGVREVFDVKTADGRVTRCCDEHLWTVMTTNDRRRGTYRTLELREFRNELFRWYSGQRTSQFFLPICKPREGTIDWRSDPWLVGFLLGDGSLKKNCVYVSCYDQECRDRIAMSLPSGVSMKHAGKTTDKHDYRLSCGNVGMNKNTLLKRLRIFDLAGKRAWEKRLPESAFHLPPEKKLELLRGLMDADGTIGKKGSDVTFTTTSEGLADDVRELIELIGGFATKNSRVTNYRHNGEQRVGRRSWTLTIRLPFCPFSLSRKRERWRPPYMARAIKSVEPAGMARTRCISVSTKRNLYVTDGHIVTHNTITTIAGIADASMLPAVVVCPSNLTLQWRNQLERFVPTLTSYVISQKKNYDLRIVANCANCGEAASGKAAALRRCQYCNGRQFTRSLADVYILSYMLASSWAKELNQFAKSVVFDEVQELRLDKSDKYAGCKELARKAQFRLGCSATPVQNYGGELYNIFSVINPGKLGDKGHFREAWCGYNDRPGREPPLKNPEAFSKYLLSQNMMIRRTRKDIGRELPVEQRIIQSIDFDQDVFSKMTKDAKELARVIVRLSEAQMNSGDSLSAAGRFRAMLYKATGLAKAPYVSKFVEILLESGEPVMLFGWHRDVYELWCRNLRDYQPLLYTGSENTRVKEHNKQAFMSGQSNLLICSLHSGVGLDGIQDRCKVGVIGELDWSPAIIEQCIGRYHRDGQADPCMTYLMISEAGCDPYMVQTLGIKRLQVDGVIQKREASAVLDQQEANRHLRTLAEKFLAA